MATDILKQFKILLVESDGHFEVISNLLKQSGAIVHVASSKSEACELYREARKQTPYNLFIFATFLSDGTGLTLAEEIRDAKDDTPIIFLMNYGASDFIERNVDRVRNSVLQKTDASSLRSGSLILEYCRSHGQQHSARLH